MGKNKLLRKAIATFLERIEEHERKIAEEFAKPTPYQPVIRKWQREKRDVQA